ncbi:MAG: alpha/beta hydrolase [Candidatus Rokubacteria bacterium]|nr:alpha/beta hydrolase [Candidatus Rokubacteria bacterium]
MSKSFGCESARHRTVQVNGLDLHCLEWGPSGTVGLCFLHGGSAHAHWFDRVAPAFASRFPAIALDQRGHGESQWPAPPSYATEDFTSDLLGVIDSLGWERTILVGHSMGGHVSMAFSAWHPERVERLVIVDSRPTIPPDRLEWMHERGRRPLRRHPSQDAAVHAFRLRPRATVADPAFLAHLARVGTVERDGGWRFRFDPDTSRLRKPYDNWQLVDRIRARTLIARAGQSPVLPREEARALQSRIAGSELVEIPGAHHHLTLDQPEAFTRELARFLAS